MKYSIDEIIDAVKKVLPEQGESEGYTYSVVKSVRSVEQYFDQNQKLQQADVIRSSCPFSVGEWITDGEDDYTIELDSKGEIIVVWMTDFGPLIFLPKSWDKYKRIGQDSI